MGQRHKRELKQLRSRGAKERKALGKKKKKAQQKEVDRKYSKLELEVKKRHVAEAAAASPHWPPVDEEAEAAAAPAAARALRARATRCALILRYVGWSSASQSNT